MLDLTAPWLPQGSYSPSAYGLPIRGDSCETTGEKPPPARKSVSRFSLGSMALRETKLQQSYIVWIWGIDASRRLLRCSSNMPLMCHAETIRISQIDVFLSFLVQMRLDEQLEAPGVKERNLAGWGLSRGKAWKGSLNVTREKKKTPPKWKPTRPCWRTRSRWNLFLHAVSEGDQGNPNGMVAGKPQTCAFYLGFTAL